MTLHVEIHILFDPFILKLPSEAKVENRAYIMSYVHKRHSRISNIDCHIYMNDEATVGKKPVRMDVNALKNYLKMKNDSILQKKKPIKCENAN